MFHRVHEKLGTAGFVISIIALIAALGGGAYAASNGLSGKQKKEVEKIAKKYAGKQGQAGSPGASGKDGANGANGTNGAPGTSGANPAGTPFSGSKTLGPVTCTEGGIEYKVGAAASLVCNGKKGTTGFTKTLPSGETETGTWSVLVPSTENFSPGAYESISFPVPLAAGSEDAFVFSQAETELEEFERTFGTPTPTLQPTGCAAPAAEPVSTKKGVMCIYTLSEERINTSSTGLEARSAGGFGYGTSGAFLAGPNLEGTAAAPARFEARGTWAVTAP